MEPQSKSGVMPGPAKRNKAKAKCGRTTFDDPWERDIHAGISPEVCSPTRSLFFSGRIFKVRLPAE